MVSPTVATTLKVLVFAASRRSESLNRKLAATAARIAGRTGARVARQTLDRDTADLASLADFDVPLHDGDVETAQGIPAEAASHCPRIKRAWLELLDEPPGAGAARVDPVPS